MRRGQVNRGSPLLVQNGAFDGGERRNTGQVVRRSRALVSPRARGVQRPASGHMGGLPRPGLVFSWRTGNSEPCSELSGSDRPSDLSQTPHQGRSARLEGPGTKPGLFSFRLGGRVLFWVRPGSTGKEKE